MHSLRQTSSEPASAASATEEHSAPVTQSSCPSACRWHAAPIAFVPYSGTQPATYPAGVSRTVHLGAAGSWQLGEARLQSETGTGASAPESIAPASRKTGGEAFFFSASPPQLAMSAEHSPTSPITDPRRAKLTIGPPAEQLLRYRRPARRRRRAPRSPPPSPRRAHAPSQTNDRRFRASECR